MNKLTIRKEDVNSAFSGHWQDFYAPYVQGLKNGRGHQYQCLCPLHDDREPSMSIDGERGLFHCFGCGAEGDPFKFYSQMKGVSDFGEILEGIGTDFGINGSGHTSPSKSFPVNTHKPIPDEVIEQFQANMTDKLIGALREKRGWSKEIIRNYRIGYDPKSKRLMIPILDAQGACRNIRRYTPKPPGDEPKTVHYKCGYGSNRLYPLESLQGDDPIIISEGEPDTLCGLSNTLNCITQTAGAGSWSSEFNDSFRGRHVIIAYDQDKAGREGAQKVAEQLKAVADKVEIIQWPEFMKNSEDLTDWFVTHGRTADDFLALQRRGGESAWEKPIFLDDFSLPEMEPLPGIIGEFSQAVSSSTETPLELPQGLCLATVATACHRKIIVQVKQGYFEQVNIWINVALESGNRKSSNHKEVTRPLSTWEVEKRIQMEPKIREAESRRRNAEARVKGLRARYGKAEKADPDTLEKIQKEILDLETKLEEIPVLPKVWVQDITPEHLGAVMAAHNECMAILSAEGGIFDILAGRYSSGVPNLDLFLQSHSGDPVRVDRGSRESIYLERPALSMGLSPQPSVLKSIADSPGFRGRGLLARFLYLLPKSRLGFRNLETEPVPHNLKRNWEKVIHQLLDLETGKDNSPRILNLQYAAYQEWLEFSRVVEVDLQEGGRFEDISDWAGKLPGAAVRLAGLLHCVKHPEQPWNENISLETMREALGLASVFTSHALKAFDLMGADKFLEGARKVWRWIERGKFNVFTKRDCYNGLKGTFRRVADIEPLLDLLEERNYIAVKREKTGGRPSVTYTVNPVLTEEWR